MLGKTRQILTIGTGAAIGTIRLRYIIVLLAIVTITIVALTVQKYYSTRRNISVAVTQEITEKDESRIQAFLGPIVSQVSIIKDWIRSGDLKTSNPANLNARFIPILEQFPQIYAIKIAGDGIGILVPEDDLISRQKSERYLYIPIALAVFWVAFLFFVRNYYRKSKELAEQGDILRISEEELSRLIMGGESDRLEFKSALRWNLKTDKAGKEIELAALKTIAAFMNPDGGALIVGVADNGKILGIDADRLENDDKFLRHFSGLLNQYIGLEFIDYIDLESCILYPASCILHPASCILTRVSKVI